MWHFLEARFEKKAIQRLGLLLSGADCNFNASPAMAEIADSVNVIEIVTNASSRNSVCTQVLVLTS